MKELTMKQFTDMLCELSLRNTVYDSVIPPSQTRGTVAVSGLDSFCRWEQRALSDTGTEVIYRDYITVMVHRPTNEGKSWFVVPTRKEVRAYPIRTEIRDGRRTPIEVSPLIGQIRGIGVRHTWRGRTCYPAMLTLSPLGAWSLTIPAVQGGNSAITNVMSVIRSSDMYRLGDESIYPSIDAMKAQLIDWVLAVFGESVREYYTGTVSLLLDWLLEAYTIAVAVQNSTGQMYTALLPFFRAKASANEEIIRLTRNMQELRLRAREYIDKQDNLSALVRKTPLKTLMEQQKLLRDLRHPFAEEFEYVSATRELLFRTKRIKMRHPETDEVYLLEPLSVRLSGALGEVTFFNPTRTYRGFWSSEDIHPHISGSGHACFGTVGGLLTETVVQGKWSEAVELVIRFLGQFDPDDSAGRYYKYYPHLLPDGTTEVIGRSMTQCSCCGQEMDEDDEDAGSHCEDCGDTVCQDCIRYAEGADRYVCDNCFSDYKTCAVCGYEGSMNNFSERHIHDVYGSRVYVCDNCADSRVWTCDICDNSYVDGVEAAEVSGERLCCPECLREFAECSVCNVYKPESEIVEGVCNECRESEEEDAETDEYIG